MRQRSDALGLAAMAAVITAVFADVLFTGSGFFVRDLYHYYWPTKWVLRETLLAGHFPSWNPFYASGQPMAANPEYEVFYPLQALILLPDYELGFRLHIVVHLYIAAFGTYALLRGLGRGIAAAIFAGLAFALGGPLLSVVNLLPMLFSAAWIPWILLAIHRLAESPTPRRIAIASLAAGIQILTFEPATLVQTWALVGLYVVTTRTRRIVPIAVSLIGGVAVGAAQFLPAFDHMRDSVRAAGIDLDTASLWSMPPLRPLELIFPRFFGLLGERGLWYWSSAVAYPRDGAPFYFRIYLGALLVPLLIAGLRTRTRAVWIGFGAVAFSFLVALGAHTPVFSWVRHIPLLDKLRYPEKFFLTGLLLMILFAAIALDRIVNGDAVARRTALVTAAVLAAASAAIAIFARGDAYRDLFIAFWRLRSNPLAAAMATMSGEQWLRPVLAFGAVAAVLALMPKMEIRLASLLLLAIVIADLGALASEIAPRMPSRFFERPPAARLLDVQGGRLFHEAQRDTRSEDAVRYTRLGDESYWMARNALLPMTPARWGVPLAMDVDYDNTFLLPSADFQRVVHFVASQRADWRKILGPMANVTQRAVYRPFPEAAEEARGDLEQIVPIRLLPMKANGRFYFADQVVTVRGPAEMATALVQRNWRPRVAFWSEPAFQPSAGSVRVVAETPARAELDVETAGPALLMSSTTHHKYWRATVDGAPTPVIQTNVAYQGVRVPTGRHKVIFRYRNDVLMIAMGISAIAIAAALILLLAGRRP